jgi:hypothetical protein
VTYHIHHNFEKRPLPDSVCGPVTAALSIRSKPIQQVTLS